MTAAEATPRQRAAEFCRLMAETERMLGDDRLASEYEALAVEVSDRPCVPHKDVELDNAVMCARCWRTKPTP